MIGYSDAVNHALAFAAKHHDQEVRKGTRAPYLTAAPSVAVILARYGQDDETLVTGIVHDAVEDFVRDGYTREMLSNRVGDKFSAEVLEAALSVVERRTDDEGVELFPEERKEDLLARLANTSVRARWALAAYSVYFVGTLLANLRRTDFPETVWGRYSAGREGTVQWYTAVNAAFRATGFDAPILVELESAVAELRRAAEGD